MHHHLLEGGAGDSRFDRATTCDTTCKLKDSSTSNGIREPFQISKLQAVVYDRRECCNAGSLAVINRRYSKRIVSLHK
jgi:hypothetical protein